MNKWWSELGGYVIFIIASDNKRDYFIGDMKILFFLMIEEIREVYRGMRTLLTIFRMPIV